MSTSYLGKDLTCSCGEVFKEGTDQKVTRNHWFLCQMEKTLESWQLGALPTTSTRPPPPAPPSPTSRTTCSRACPSPTAHQERGRRRRKELLCQRKTWRHLRFVLKRIVRKSTFLRRSNSNFLLRRRTWVRSKLSR